MDSLTPDQKKKIVIGIGICSGVLVVMISIVVAGIATNWFNPTLQTISSEVVEPATDNEKAITENDVEQQEPSPTITITNIVDGNGVNRNSGYQNVAFEYIESSEVKLYDYSNFLEKFVDQLNTDMGTDISTDDIVYMYEYYIAVSERKYICQYLYNDAYYFYIRAYPFTLATGYQFFYTPDGSSSLNLMPTTLSMVCDGCSTDTYPSLSREFTLSYLSEDANEETLDAETDEEEEEEEDIPQQFEVTSITDENGDATYSTFTGSYTRVDPPTISIATVQWKHKLAGVTDDDYQNYIIYDESDNMIKFRMGTNVSTDSIMESSPDQTYSFNPLSYTGTWTNWDQSIYNVEFSLSYQ
jgi:hypothetical protein